MSATLRTDIANELREIAARLQSDEFVPPIVDQLRDGDFEAEIGDIVYEWPFSTVAAVLDRAEDELYAALRDHGTFVADDFEDAVRQVVSLDAEAVQKELKNQGEGGPTFDADDVRCIIGDLESLASEVSQLRHALLEDVPCELDDLTYRLESKLRDLETELEL